MLIGTESLALGLTLVESAQCFHWVERNGRFGAVVAGEPVWLWRDEKGIQAEGTCSADAVRRYLDLDRDYAAIAAAYAHIPAARRAIELYPGLRVLNQPPWEALVAFILSANNNVARIRGLVQALCASYGRRLDCGDAALYAFPTPERLAACREEELRALKVGYRAAYLIGTARRICDGFPLDALRDMPYAEAHSLLTTLPGVGDKVADCALLFGCGHAEAFPVDVWVARLLRDWFGMTCKSRPAMAREARERLGAHAGILQQFLFHAARMGELAFPADRDYSVRD